MEINLEKDKVERANEFLSSLRVHYGDIEKYINKLESYVRCFYASRPDTRGFLKVINQVKDRMPELKEVFKNREQINTMAERGRPFDKTKYDRNIFKAAMVRYKLANGYDKKYGRCLLAELKERKIADDKYKETTEFRNWEIAFRQYRHEEHLTKKPRKKLGRANKRS
jgi:hypothetical protein